MELPNGDFFPLQESLTTTGEAGESLIWFIFDTDRKSAKGAQTALAKK